MVPSRALLPAAAALLAASAPFSLAEGGTSSAGAAPPVDVDASSVGAVPPAVEVGVELPPLLSVPPAEFLQHASPSVVLSATFPAPELHSLFEEWRGDFGREYPTLREHALRKLTWLRNHARISSHNTQSPPAGHSLAHNDFSDLSQEEFRERFYLGEHSPGVFAPRGMDDGSWFGSPSRKLLRGEEEGRAGEGPAGPDLQSGEAWPWSHKKTTPETPDAPKTPETPSGEDAAADEAGRVVDDVPEHKDWREEGAVTAVKNQWFCGACWAFSAVGAIEGARYIKTGNLTELSIQQLLDCDMTDLGCSGGLMAQAFTYDASDGVGLCSLEEYPFAYHRHWFYGCKRYMPYCTPLPHTKVQEYVNVTKTEADLKAAVATQPVSVAVAADGFDWQFYSGGVLRQDCADPEKIDHGVLAVGYGHYDPSADPSAKPGGDASDYWLIKNSWGERWGMDGYIRLARGTGNEAGGGSACVLTLASRPIMKAED